MTLPERLLWSELKENRIGFRVLTQHPVGDYVLDFFIRDALLCIEIDGWGHAMQGQHDHKRDQALDLLGIETIRISSYRVKSDRFGVARYVQRLARERADRQPE